MKAREEAERKQKELEEKLKKEEEERSARKKRIEEIMARTRGGGGGNGGATTPTSTPKKVLTELLLCLTHSSTHLRSGSGNWVSLPIPSVPSHLVCYVRGITRARNRRNCLGPLNPSAKVYSTLTSNVVGRKDRKGNGENGVRD